jgi:RNA-binding protein Musashi
MSSVKCQILVQNLPKHTTSKQLQQYASRYGSIVDAYLTDNDSEGFIEFTERTSVDVFMSKRPHFLDAIELQCQRCLPSNELQKPVKRIFLRGPVQQLTESRLSNHFDKYGKVVSCTIPKGKRNSTFTHFGYAFVAFDDEDVVDRIIQDKPHYIDDVELEVEKAEDLTRNNHRRSRSRSPSSPINNKRSRHETSSSPSVSVKRIARSTDEFSIRHLEEENRRLREHAIMAKHHFDENIWKLRRELDDERRRYEQLKIDYDYVRRDLARITGDLQQKSSTRYNNSNSKSSRH